MIELTEREKKVLMHTLTGSSGKRKSYRNYYAASKGHHSMQELEQLVEKGAMVRGHEYGDEGHYYHCTEAGATAVGLSLPKD